MKTLEQILAIKDKVRSIGIELKDGDWKSAYHLATMMTSDVNFTKQNLDDMKSDILAYITANYSW